MKHLIYPAAGALALSLASLQAAEVTFQGGTLTDTSTNWQDASANTSARLTGASDKNIITFGASTAVSATGPINFGASTLALTNVSQFSNTASGAGSRTAITFSGGTLEVTGSVVFGGTSTAAGNAANRLNVNGDFTKTGTGTVTFNSFTSGGGSLYSGTITINDGTVSVASSGATGTASNFALNAGTLTFSTGQNGDINIGSLAGNGGTVNLSYNSGSVGTVRINQTSNTTYAGNFTGTNSGAAQRTLVKLGTGTLTLSGTSTAVQATTVGAGTLAINGNWSGASGAVTVGNSATTATLVGTGTIGGATTIGGSTGTARLSAGTDSTVGTFTFNQSLTLNAVADTFVNGGGSSFDKIVVGTTLTLGGELFFDFTSAVAAGNHVLFDANTFAGTFTSVAYTGTSQVTGTWVKTGSIWTDALNDLTFNESTGILTSAIPEPSTYALFAGAGFLGFAVYRRRRN